MKRKDDPNLAMLLSYFTYPVLAMALFLILNQAINGGWPILR